MTMIDRGLLETIHDMRAHGRVIGLCNGCFDLLHPGHVDFLTKAALHCEHLVVGLNTDEWMVENKRPPLFDWEQRCFMLNALECVGSVLAFDGDVLELAGLVQPAVILRGRGQVLTEWEKGLQEGQVIWVRTIPLHTTDVVRTVLASVTWEVTESGAGAVESAIEVVPPISGEESEKGAHRPSEAPRELSYVMSIADMHIYEDRTQWLLGRIIGKEGKRVFKPAYYCATKKGLIVSLTILFRERNVAWIRKQLDALPDQHPDLRGETD